MIKLHSLLAVRAIHKCEYDSWRGPLVLQNRLDAVDVIDVATTKFDAWLRAQPTSITNCTVGVFVCIVKK